MDYDVLLSEQNQQSQAESIAQAVTLMLSRTISKVAVFTTTELV
jgi:hypothetical protein